MHRYKLLRVAATIQLIVKEFVIEVTKLPLISDVSPVSLPLSKLPVDSFTILGTGEGTSTGLGGSATATALSTEPATSPPGY